MFTLQKCLVKIGNILWNLPEQDSYLLCFTEDFACFVYERINLGINDPCQLPLKSHKSCGRNILVPSQTTFFSDKSSSNSVL